MSRIGKQPIKLPSGVTVELDGRDVTVKGGKGELRYTLPRDVDLRIEDGVLTLIPGTTRQANAMHGLARARLAIAVQGVNQGFKRTLEIEGTGYRAEAKGGNLELQLGFSHTVVFEPPTGVTCACDSPTRVVVSGIDKVAVGQAAADIRRLRPAEPYKGKGIRYEGERVRRKAGKSGAGA